DQSFVSQTRGVEPRSMHAYPCAHGYTREEEALNEEASQKPARQILAFTDRQGIEKCRAVVIDVLVGGLTGNRGGNDHAEHAQERDDGIQRKRRVDKDLAARPKIQGGTGKCTSANERKQEGQCEQNQEIKIGGDAAQPLAKLKQSNCNG